MEYTAVFEETVSLTPKDLRSEIKGLDTLLEGKLRARLEGRCSRHGFVVLDSVRILSRSMGAIDKGRFTGNVLFHVQAEGKVLNPSDKTILDAEVIRKNKMGLYLNYRDAIRIIIPRDGNIGRDEFDLIELGETITVEIKKSRFQVNDPYVLSVGVFLKRSDNVAAALAEKEESEEESKEESEEESKEESEEESEEESKEESKEESETKEAESESKESEMKESGLPASKKRFQLRGNK
jgi:F0F1-type ATP synthase epsilon subunit